MRALQDGAFQDTGTFEFFLEAGAGIETHKKAVATVKFVPVVYGDNVTRVFPFDEPTNLGTAAQSSLQVSLGDGYRHSGNKFAAAWRPSIDEATQKPLRMLIYQAGV